MAARRISIKEFINLAKEQVVIDVRSPSEFSYACFPDAHSVPLFNDEERKIVGTAYKQQSREEAIKMGLDYFGVKMKNIVNEVEQLLQNKNSKTVLVYCWRGGMRSGAISWLLDIYGFEVFTLDGGYKKYRNWVLEKLAHPYPLRILSGKTGSGKTEILSALNSMGEWVIDLEKLALHKGSTFGGLGLPPQPSTEQFENNLAMALHFISENKNNDAAIWLESESSRIGQINIHHSFFMQMKAAPRLHIHISFEQRLEYIFAGYGHFAVPELVAAVERIKKRLGGLDTKNTLEYLVSGDIKMAFRILLKYYDKYYEKSKSIFQNAFMTIDLPSTDAATNSQIILNKIK